MLNETISEDVNTNRLWGQLYPSIKEGGGYEPWSDMEGYEKPPR